MNDSFIDRVRKIIIDHLEDEKFGVKELAEELGLSRSQVLRKVKAATGGKSVNLFIRELRLREAAMLLLENDLTASETAFRVGFSSPSYFNKCFLDYFGITPGEYKQSKDPSSILASKTLRETTHWSTNSRKVLIASGIFLIIIITLFGYKTTKKSSFLKNKNLASIAILPFLDLSEDKMQEYLADGITEAITLELSKYNSLRVISRTSAMRYKNEKRLSSEIAKELGVDLLLEGSVLHSKDSLRVVVQLIEPFPDEKHIWASSYDRKYSDILGIVGRISNQVADEINLTLNSSVEDKKAEKITPDALDAYLRGRHLWNQQNPKALNGALNYLQKCIRIEPDFAPAYSVLAETYISLNKMIRDNEKKLLHREKALQAIKKALELDNKSGSSYITYGNYLGKFEWDWEGLKKAADKGLKIEPNNIYGHLLLSNYHLVKGNYKKSTEEAKIAEKLDPLNPMTGSLVAQRYYISGDYEKSIEKYQEVLDMFPGFGFAWNGIGYAQYYSGNEEQAIKSWQKLQVIMGNESIADYFTRTDIENSIRYWLKHAKGPSPQFCSNPSIISAVHMMLDEKVDALTYLEVAFQYKDEDLPIMLPRPEFHDLHSDSLFQNLVKETGVVLP